MDMMFLTDEYTLIILFGYLFLFAVSLSVLFTVVFNVPIISDEGPWKCKRWHDVDKSSMIVTNTAGEEFLGIRLYTFMKHLNTACHDPVAFNEACMELYGTKRNQILIKGENNV